MKRPSLFWYFLEIPRAILERISAIRFFKNYHQLKKGDGHPIYLIPGFLASETSFNPLKVLLNRLGYIALHWGFGRNMGKLDTLDLLSEKIETLYAETNQKITIIGWSLGGVYARELAKLHPEKIRQVITLGSPFSHITFPNNASWLFRLINPNQTEEILGKEWFEALAQPAPVRTVAFYSKTDGIVPWKACMEKTEDDLHENIEVSGSHFGLGVNKEVLKIMLERL